MDANGIRIYPMHIEPFGNDIIGAHAKHFGADLVITLQDIWILPDDYVDRFRPAKWAPWMPIDHNPCPPRVTHMMKKADYPIVYSLFGLQEATREAVPNVTYIPHGIETGIFKPGDKATARRQIGAPENAYIVSMVAANKGFPSRKAFGENLSAFGEFAKMHPEAILYLHTVRGPQQGGVNFDALIPACDIPFEKVRFVDQYLNAIGLQAEYMASVYQASDVLLASSMGEGFGIPIVEAQACGCPVVTTAWTSSPELTINGICTEPAQPAWTLLDSWMCTPSVKNILDALEAIHAWEPAYRSMMSAKGIAHVYANFDWDMLVRDYWAPFLARVEADIARNREDNVGHEQVGIPVEALPGQPG